ncbi:MAG: TolC family protein [Elusimicrobia bacterium]|nr:TolC family protein [Elusimicrobiota bacterium]
MREALGDYRRALNRVHGLGLNPGTAALEAQDLPGLEEGTLVTPATVEAKTAQQVHPFKASLSYIRRTSPAMVSAAPGTVFGVPVPGAAAVSGMVVKAFGGAGEKKVAAALAAAQSDFVAKSRLYEIAGDFEALAKRNERVARLYWLNVVRPQVESVFPGNYADLGASKNLATAAAQFHEDLGKKTEEARLALARALGRSPAEADAASVRSLSGRPPTVQWVGHEGSASAESHPAALAAGAEGQTAAELAKANALSRFMPDVSFNIEEVLPATGGSEKIAPVVRIYMNATPSVEGALKSEAFEADSRAAALREDDQIRQIKNELDDLRKRISDGGEALQAQYESLQSARKVLGDKLAAYERYGVAETGHAVQLAGFGPVQEAIDNYNKALENYSKTRADFELALARFNNLIIILGQIPTDFLQVNYDSSGALNELALPPPAKATDQVKIPFPGLLPGSMSRPGFTFEQRFDTSRAANHPLAGQPTHYVEINLATENLLAE